MDALVLRELDSRMKKCELKYHEAIKNYGRDSREVLDPVEEYIYLMGWWILYVQGCTQVWFTPWYFFKGTDGYQEWKFLQSEVIFAKSNNWFGI
jgi:hypothetical protein